MELIQIYKPIKKELNEVEEILKASLKKSRHQSIHRIGSFMLESPGKRIRPALLILSAKATLNGHRISTDSHSHLANIASAVELIHMASLVHDDIIDRAILRHNRPTINSKWGQDISIVLGDYLYSVAFGLISQCGNKDILRCLSSAVELMCEGELLQVCGRGNFNLSQQEYLFMVKKKTAGLFSACCQTGVLISNHNNSMVRRLEDYGMNIGIVFQIIDDYLDLIGDEEDLGKDTGQDIRLGEITLPILKLWESLSHEDRKELKILFRNKLSRDALQRIRERFFEFQADSETKDIALSFTNLAKERIHVLPRSPYKDSLIGLADFIIERGFNGRLKKII